MAEEAGGRIDEALAQAWAALDAAPRDHEAKVVLVQLLSENPRATAPERAGAIRQLLGDPEVDPSLVAAAGWQCVKQAESLRADPPVLAQWLEGDGLAQSLLREALVSDYEVEAPLTALRRWLLLSKRWREFPNSVASLAAQAAFHGGAWLFDDTERDALADAPELTPAYAPANPLAPGGRAFEDATTAAVARQYELWPYPVWSRLMVPKSHRSLAQTLRHLDPDGLQTMPAAPQILIAGCGTGRDAALAAGRYPEARVTAIDISESSLRFAGARNAGSGIEFHRLDLYRVAELGRRFDAIFSLGVLHHLPDPEGGWAALTQVLKPGGIMRVMLYSKIARLKIAAVRRLVADLIDKPVDAELLRAVRRRVIAGVPAAPTSADFYSLSGVHDLLLHRHEDAFDVARVRRAIDSLGLELLAFEFPDRAARAQYENAYPDDPKFRSYANWQAFELRHPMLFAGMYNFWCRKPL